MPQQIVQYGKNNLKADKKTPEIIISLNIQHFSASVILSQFSVFPVQISVSVPQKNPIELLLALLCLTERETFYVWLWLH